MWARGLDDRPVDRDASSSRPARTGRSRRSCIRIGAARVHRAEPAVPDGQPVGVRAGRDAPVHRRRAHVPVRAAPHRHRRRARRLRQGRREDRPRRKARSYGEFPALRAGPLHVPRRLPAVRQRRRHGASQQHGDDRRRHRSRRRARPARHGRARVLPLLERRAHPAEGARAVRLRSRRTCRASSGWPKASRSTTGRSRCSARSSSTCASTARHVRRARSRRVVDGPGQLVRSAEEMSRMAPFIDGGRAIDRTNWSTHVHLVLPVRRRDRAGARSDAARAHRRPAVARRLHARDVARATASRAARREGYVDRPYTIADAEATLAEVSGDRAFARDFFARYIQGHEVADYAAAARARRLRRAQAARRDAPGSATCASNRATAGASPRSFRRPGRFTRPASTKTTSCSRSTGSGSASDGDIAAVLQRHKPGDTVAVVFVDRTGSAEESERDAGRGSTCRGRAGRAGALHRRRRSAFRDRWLGAK